jgi:hypothetical protein
MGIPLLTFSHPCRLATVSPLYRVDTGRKGTIASNVLPFLLAYPLPWERIYRPLPNSDRFFVKIFCFFLLYRLPTVRYQNIAAYSLKARKVEPQQLVVTRQRSVNKNRGVVFLRSPCRWLRMQQWNTSCHC